MGKTAYGQGSFDPPPSHRRMKAKHLADFSVYSNKWLQAFGSFLECDKMHQLKYDAASAAHIKIFYQLRYED